MYGNELVGIQVFSIFFKLLELEFELNFDFCFWGCIVGFKGNLWVIENGVCFFNWDFNCQWCFEVVEYVFNILVSKFWYEEFEILELYIVVMEEIQDYQFDEVIVFDFYIIIVYGGIFFIVIDDFKSVNIVVELYVLVIIGLLEGIQGMIFYYFNMENIGVEIIIVCFEFGQYEEILLVNWVIVVIINCMCIIGCVCFEDVENWYDVLFIEYVWGLLKVFELIIIYFIELEDYFCMVLDYKNFQKVKQGEIFVFDCNGLIEVIEDGLILMLFY